MEFNLLMLTRFEVTTMDSQEPTCTDNSYQTLNEVGVNSYLIRCVTEVPNSTEDGSTTLCFTDQVISSCPIAAMSLCNNTTRSQTIPQVERGVTALMTPQFETVIIKVSTVQALRSRGNPRHGVIHLPSFGF